MNFIQKFGLPPPQQKCIPYTTSPTKGDFFTESAFIPRAGLLLLSTGWQVATAQLSAVSLACSVKSAASKIGTLYPPAPPPKKKNYFTSSDPHHDMLGGGCQVRVVIKNMMGRMENLRTLISGFLGLVILVRWALVTMFLS